MNTPEEESPQMAWVNPNLWQYYAVKLLGILLVTGPLGYVCCHRSAYFAADSRDALLYLAPLVGSGFLLLSWNTLRDTEPADTKLGILLKMMQLLLSLPCIAYLLLTIFREMQNM
jgi:hypothetical protein